MTRLAGLALLLVAAAAALALYQIKFEVAALEEDLDATRRSIFAQEEAMQVLHAEWSYLNRPERIADLAERHLGLQQMSAEQILRIDRLPQRPVQAVALEGAAVAESARGAE
jgi:hypothetical protein